MTSLGRRISALVGLLAALPMASEARIVFTGYSDLRYDTGLRAKIATDPATATSLSIQSGSFIARGFNADAIGLFATTEVQERVQFLTDITFRQIGANVNQLTLQYAYLHWTPFPDTALNGGKITVPFGYYNENRFYAFQRTTITPPIFQGSILGLPIADWGVAASQQLPMTGFTPEITAYAVNGYGSVPGSKTSFRSATLPGGLAISNNLGAADNNNKPSVGARLRLKEIGGMPIETGASYYWGNWDSSGIEPMSLTGAHVHANVHKIDFLAEAIHLNVRGDQGFVSSIGATNWSTTGGFAVLSFQAPPFCGKTITPYLQGEYYRTRPNNGDAARETVRSAIAGASARLSDSLLLKAEFLHLIYELPNASKNGFLRLDADGALLSLVVTF